MAATKTAAPKKQGFQGVKNAIIILIFAFIVAVCFYMFVLGNPANFADQVEKEGPVNMLGTVYKGGFVVPIIFGLLFSVIALSIERIFAISACAGTGNVTKFVEAVKAALKAGDFAKAQQLCDKQRGSIGNVVSASLKAYQDMDKATGMKKKEKIARIQQAHEEATQLEMPTMTMNLPIIATIVTLGTLTALFGTVLGMIRSFAALASDGGADSMALSTGISEALVNTASGIATSWVAVVAYNYFTNRIDKLTFALDEIGYTIAQTFEVNHTEEA